MLSNMTFMEKLEQILCEHDYVYIGTYNQKVPILHSYDLYKCRHCEKKKRETF